MTPLHYARTVACADALVAAGANLEATTLVRAAPHIDSSASAQNSAPGALSSSRAHSLPRCHSHRHTGRPRDPSSIRCQVRRRRRDDVPTPARSQSDGSKQSESPQKRHHCTASSPSRPIRSLSADATIHSSALCCMPHVRLRRGTRPCTWLLAAAAWRLSRRYSRKPRSMRAPLKR